VFDPDLGTERPAGFLFSRVRVKFSARTPGLAALRKMRTKTGGAKNSAPDVPDL